MNLRERLQPYLKKAYFNARTDVVAERNHVVPPGGHHVAPAIDNMTQELAATIAADLKGMLPKRKNHQMIHHRAMDGVCTEACGAEQYNQAIDEMSAALDRYTGVNELNKEA